MHQHTQYEINTDSESITSARLTSAGLTSARLTSALQMLERKAIQYKHKYAKCFTTIYTILHHTRINKELCLI